MIPDNQAKRSSKTGCGGTLPASNASVAAAAATRPANGRTTPARLVSRAPAGRRPGGGGFTTVGAVAAWRTDGSSLRNSSTAQYDSTTSATGSYTLVASGVTGTAWTSGTLTNNTNYWFEVTALIGANWASVTSAASPESTIKPQSPLCVQP